MNRETSEDSIIRSERLPANEAAPAKWRLSQSGRRLALGQAAWLGLVLLCLGLYLASIPPHFTALQTPCDGPTCLAWQLSPEQVVSLQQRGISLKFYAIYLTALGLSVALVHIVIAALIFWRKSSDWLALFGSLALLTFGVAGMNDVSMAALVAIYPVWRLPVSALMIFGDIGMLIFFCLFPDGHFVPRWTRWLALGWVLFRLPGIFFPLSPFDKNIGSLTGLVWIGFLGGLVVAQVYRYRHVSTSIQRQQTKWIVFGLSVAIVGFLGIVFGWRLLAPAMLFDLSSPYSWAAITVIDVLWLLVPLSIGLAILRYRLWDIDFLINWTLVYGLLTASIVGLYVLLVGGLSTLFQTSGNLLISLLATAVVAMLFAPLRDRLQRGVNRLLYGQRDDPYAILSRLGRQLEATLAPDAVLPAIVTTIHDALKLPYVAIALDQEGQSIEAAAAGQPAPNPLWLPLNYQGETIGCLILAPRAPSEAFTPAERRLLEDLTHQSGVAAAAVRLTADLQRSRERLVTAREEERRRLRRDLHDGLGPQLAAQTLKLEAARDLLYTNPQRAEALITGLIGKSQGLIAEIRRLVYALRPPALDELGLLGAVRELTNHGELNGLQITLSTPQRLSPLPAAVEVAAYRIVQEALTNVIRHAHARTCLITVAFIEQPAALHIEVRDDGRGLSPEHRAGVGLNSMRERTEELGGEWRVETRIDGGTQVLACLPLSRN